MRPRGFIYKPGGESAAEPAVVALTDAATIALDASLGTAFSVTLGGNRTLANPTNLVAGMAFDVILTQDATRGRRVTFGTYYDFGSDGPPDTASPFALWSSIVVHCLAVSTTKLVCTYAHRGAGPIFPATGPQHTAITGRTATALYPMRDYAYNLKDVIGSAHLTQQLGVIWARYGARFGAMYGPAGGAGYHANDYNAVGANSFIASGVHFVEADPGFVGLQGRSNAGGTEQWIMWVDSGTVSARLRDDGAGDVTVTTGAVQLTAAPALVSLQVDKTAGLAKLRVSQIGLAAVTAQESIVGLGTLEGAVMTDRVGTPPGLNYGSACLWRMLEIGASAEGAAALANLHAAMGWE